MSKSLSPRSSIHWVAGNGHPVPLRINPFIVASAAALVLGLSSGWPEPLQTLLIVPLLLGGLIHGAVDLARLSRLRFISLIPAAGIYLLVACLSLLCFVSYPLIGLAAILASPQHILGSRIQNSRLGASMARCYCPRRGSHNHSHMAPSAGRGLGFCRHCRRRRVGLSRHG